MRGPWARGAAGMLAVMAVGPAAAEGATKVVNAVPFVGYSIEEEFGEAEGFSIQLRTDVVPSRLEVTKLDPANPANLRAINCSSVSPSEVHCPAGPTGGSTILGGSRPALVVHVKLGFGADRLEERSPASSSLFSDPLRVDGGNGNDVVIGGRGGDSLRGDEGNDVLDGGLVVDVLEGGDDDDRLNGGAGGDELNGGRGDDLLEGGDGNDKLGLGNAADPGDDVLAGGAGNDELSDVPGALGASGVDRFTGGSGADRINTRDGLTDVSINCGSNALPFVDRAEVDLVDPKALDCEIVDRFASDDGPPGGPASKRLRLRRTGRSSVRIACPRDAKVRCRGRMSVRDPRRRARVLASARYAIRLGGRRSVVVRLSSGERALLRRRGRALLTTREKGVSRKGPRSAERVVTVAG